MEKWNIEKIPSQAGRIVIVTGSSSGIGFEAAKVLSTKGAELIIAVRNAAKGEIAKAQIMKESPAIEPRIMCLDLADLKSVKDFVNEYSKHHATLDLLINNAGVMIPPYSKTADGFELQFGTNHLGHFALTAQLFDLLKSTQGSRIVNVSSTAHRLGNINFDDLNWEKRKYRKWFAYGDSKISNLYFTYHMASQLSKNGNNPIAVAAHPGWSGTELQRHSGFAVMMNHLFAQSRQMGALPTLYAAVADDVRNGDFIGPDRWMQWRGFPVKVKPNSKAMDMKAARKLWEKSEEMTNLKFRLS